MAGDLVQSLGVIAAAIIIYVGDKNGHPEWKIADPICTFLFSVLVLITTVPIFGDMMRLLLEGTPIDSVDTIELFDAITKVSKLTSISSEQFNSTLDCKFKPRFILN
jgi:Co/Zn/Cd efflux system component